MTVGNLTTEYLLYPFLSFDPHFPCGGAIFFDIYCHIFSRFQFMLPMRGATAKRSVDRSIVHISIHTFMTGADGRKASPKRD